MSLGNSEEDFNLPCGQTVTDTGLTAPNLELPLGRGESSSISYPCLEGHQGQQSLFKSPTLEHGTLFLHLCIYFSKASAFPEIINTCFEFHANLPSKSAFNEVEFKFSYSRRIKECGVRLLNVSSYQDDSDGSSEKEYNQSGEKDSGLTALNPEVSLGQVEASSLSSYPSMEGEALCVYSIITEQQDADIPILNRLISCHHGT
ncbi:hypothetical protein AXX17_AT4G20010 [Arabidopsis thaliana]|nr:hypothetical protein AXX17_AT4G20010 [Arabidopsis thaliana]